MVWPTLGSRTAKRTEQNSASVCSTQETLMKYSYIAVAMKRITTNSVLPNAIFRAT